MPENWYSIDTHAIKQQKVGQSDGRRGRSAAETDVINKLILAFIVTFINGIIREAMWYWATTKARS